MMENRPFQEGRRSYRILQVVGVGGYGTVYEAELRVGEVSRRVALKVVRQGNLSDQQTARLRDEARVLGMLRHQCIVTVDSLVILDGHLAMVMELVQGAPLSDLLERGPLPPRASLELLRELARALEAARKARNAQGLPLNLVHRDIKPANVMLTEGGEVKLLDFGIARTNLEDRQAHTTQGAMPGTWNYLSPERQAGRPAEAPSDIYALGALLYELLRGERLGQLSLDSGPYTRMLEVHLDLLAETLGGDSPLLSLLQNLLAFDPGARPAARELVHICEQLLPQTSGLSLVSWAETAVPEVLKRPRPTSEDPRVGRSFSEEAQLSTTSSELSDEPAPISKLKTWVKGLTALLIPLGALLSQVETIKLRTCHLLGLECETVESARPLTFYADRDGDGHGDPALVIEAQSAPLGAVSLGDDCDDQNASVHPTQRETPGDDVDNDCDPGSSDKAPNTLQAGPVVQVTQAPAPTETPTVTDPPTPGPVDQATPSSGPKSPPAPGPRPEQPATVRFRGDAERVVLHSRGKPTVTLTLDHSSGTLSPGDWSVTAYFLLSGERGFPGERMTVRAGDSLTLSCLSANEGCVKE